MAASLPTGPFQNAEAIYKGLLAMGLSTNAAAGVAGNIYQESHGNPSESDSAGGGLFGETTSNGGTVSGGSLTEQLAALAKYIAANGSVSDINAHASSPTEAATYFQNKYERPGIPDTSNRTAAANWVATAAKSGDWGTNTGQSDSGAGDIGGGTIWPTQITDFATDANSFLTAAMWLFKPGSWVRVGAFLAGITLLLVALWALLAVAEGEPIFKMPKVVPVPV